MLLKLTRKLKSQTASTRELVHPWTSTRELLMLLLLQMSLLQFEEAEEAVEAREERRSGSIPGQVVL